jgi:predicted transcriptional regulator
MNQKDFDRLAEIHRLKKQTAEACQRVLVNGETAYSVAKDMNIAESTISRALKRLDRPVCKSCGQPVRE